MAVYKYLDLSTSHLTEREATEIGSSYAFGELDHSPRVIPHDYGVWVNVPDVDGSWSAEDTSALRVCSPNLAACIDHARRFGCLWINFDQDGDVDGGLPTFDW